MYAIDELFRWTDIVVATAELLLWVWALVDCITRKPAAFTAVGKLTKTGWTIILALSALFGYLVAQPFTWANPVNPIPLIATICSAVYLADVRPAIKEITGRR